MIFGGARRRRRPHYLSSVLPLQVVLHDWLFLLFFLLSSFAVVVLDARIYVDIFEQDNKVYHHYEDHYRHLVLPSVAYFKVPNLDSSTPRWTQPHLLIKGFLRYYEGGGTDPGTTSTSSTSSTINVHQAQQQLLSQRIHLWWMAIMATTTATTRTRWDQMTTTVTGKVPVVIPGSCWRMLRMPVVAAAATTSIPSWRKPTTVSATATDRISLS